MLPLLLLLPKDSLKIRYLEFFFLKLTRTSERDHFLKNFHDKELKETIGELIMLFVKYPFKSQEIKEFVHRNFSASKEKAFNDFLKKITKLQWHFYKDVYREFRESGKSMYYDQIIKDNYASFRLSTTEDETELELIYMDLYFDSNKEKMSEKEIKDFMFRRLIKAAGKTDS